MPIGKRHEQLRHEYLTCAACIYPSLYEGFGLPVLEALELDCLALTSRDTVMQEVGGECGIYFDPYSPQDIADKIESIYAPGFNRAQQLARRTSVLEKYSWEQTARRILDVLNAAA